MRYGRLRESEGGKRVPARALLRRAWLLRALGGRAALLHGSRCGSVALRCKLQPWVTSPRACRPLAAFLPQLLLRWVAKSRQEPWPGASRICCRRLPWPCCRPSCELSGCGGRCHRPCLPAKP